MNHLSRKEQRLILNLMCRHSCIADIADVTGHSTTTIRRHLVRFGEALAASHDRLVREISPSRLQFDEIWSYVYAKREKNLLEETRTKLPPPDFGEYYTWVALDPDSKLFVSWQVGDRGEGTGSLFATDVSMRVKGRALITTDGHVVYPGLIKDAFGSEVDHVVIEKEIKSWRNPETGERGSRFKRVEKIQKTRGDVNLALATTSHVERLNASIRNFTSRFTRQTYKFSKRLENHVHAQAIFVMYYNFVREHKGFKGPERHWTPAIKAGLTDRPWSYDDLLDEVDRYWQRKALRPVLQVVPPRKYVPLRAGETSSLPYFVMYSPNKREAKVHRGTCHACRQGLGKKDRPSPNQWFALETQKAARICAEALSPLHHSVCSICIIGQYVKYRVRSK